MRAAEPTTKTKQDFLTIMSDGDLNSHSSPIAEINFAQQGITTQGLRAFANHLHWEIASIAKAIGTTERTLIRNKTKRLSMQVSENALEIARLSGFGADYFGGVDNWNQWLDSPNLQFNGEPPRSVINTIRGRELIRRVINGLKYGFTA
ncbi:MbcA/ParS/Xre antitoxin family protein [Pseudoalteromonas sp. OFAV1]|jgi:putative toxin-antitoxin system antitoxin component (TIGR02293 family)|uniref:antitoxin Xre/MbcA/ParS toxin-binding domain-containing protein n=1 Tax=Pseudoalteromonas sp. OFAV1 TaxID=2908892 RepID=UPI001F19962C|nr:antitoxin Xre/MbcA/ParS toxin-binding domain-containing protein [Pseudoalteromonas sp. OFAV1]MCF2902229.1 MbcA/ParS/Xre antitoxin family protein [Pseudoalteromonas sp. OFAV1]